MSPIRVQSVEFSPELPSASAELELIRTGALALIRTLGPRKADRFIREWAAILANEEVVRRLFPRHTAEERAAATRAHREALQWMREAFPQLLASVPPE